MRRAGLSCSICCLRNQATTSDYVGDDTTLAHALDSEGSDRDCRVCRPKASAAFALPTTQPMTFGAVNLRRGRSGCIAPGTRDIDALAVMALQRAGIAAPRGRTGFPSALLRPNAQRGWKGDISRGACAWRCCWHRNRMRQACPRSARICFATRSW